MIDKIYGHREVEQDLAVVTYKFDKYNYVPENLYFEHHNQLFFHDAIKKK
jgi:hypothetical protein